MKLFLIRHGESEADLMDVHEGRADFPLTPRGEKQARALAEWMAARYPLDAVYASTLKRAAKTAELLAEGRGLSVHPMPELMEFNNGLLAGLERGEAAKKYPEVKGLPSHESMYGMESQLQFRFRAETALSKLLSETKGCAAVAAISHGGMINQLFNALLSLPVQSNAAFLSGDTGVHLFSLENGRVRVAFTNSREHLTGDLR